MYGSTRARHIRQHERGRVHLLDRSPDRKSGCRRCSLFAIVHRTGDEAAGLGQPHIAAPDQRTRSIGTGIGMRRERRLAHHAGGLDAERDELHRLALGDEAVHRACARRRSLPPAHPASPWSPDRPAAALAVRSSARRSAYRPCASAAARPARYLPPRTIRRRALPSRRNASAMVGIAASPSVVSRVAAKSARRSVSSNPMAHRMPGLRGTRTRPMSSSRASRAACSGPAPPNATSV